MKRQGSVKEYLKAAAQRRPRAAPCLDEDQLVEFYLGRLEESRNDSIQDHLAECADCLELSKDVRQFLAAMDESVDSIDAVPAGVSHESPFGLGVAPRLFLLAASLAIAVGAGLWFWRASRVEAPPPQAQRPQPTPSATTTPENQWRDLQIAKAQYTPATTPRDEPLYRDDSPQAQRKPSAFAQAMQPYERNDFAEADRRLGQFTEKNPSHAAAQFYRGVSLLLLGKSAEAIAPLETAVTKGEGRMREEAHWYLALTYLKTGDHLKALEQLDNVVQISGKRRSDAEALRKQVKPIVDTKQ
jgi:tetratricopeptide (TPR) repeat protein